jgi:uncharacterized protein YecT (DUF1311 family)
MEPGNTTKTELDAERERLRKQGYTKAEISQILIARAVGGGAPKSQGAPLPRGVLSNVLGSVVAVGGYAAGLFTTIRHDVATMVDASSKPSARAGAFASLLFKAAMIGVLGFAARQEWQQHIMSATQTAADDANSTAFQAKKEFADGHYVTAYDFEKQRREVVEKLETKSKGQAGAATAGALVGVSWYALFAQEYSEALAASSRAVELNPPELAALTNKAHALMFLGNDDEARKIYRAHRGEKVDDKRTWNETIIGDFAGLRKAGLSNPLMDQVTRDLASDQPPAPPPKAEATLPPDSTPIQQSPLANHYVPVTDGPASAASAAPESEARAEVTPPTDISPSDKQKLAAAVNRNVFASAVAPSAPAATLRTPTAFNCAKASMGVDYVICAFPELMDAEARLEDAFHAARTAKGDQVATEQWAWIKRYGADCGLPLRGRPADGKIQGVAGCVRSAMEQRIKELQAEQ